MMSNLPPPPTGSGRVDIPPPSEFLGPAQHLPVFRRPVPVLSWSVERPDPVGAPLETPPGRRTDFRSFLERSREILDSFQSEVRGLWVEIAELVEVDPREAIRVCDALKRVEGEKRRQLRQTLKLLNIDKRNRLAVAGMEKWIFKRDAHDAYDDRSKGWPSLRVERLFDSIGIETASDASYLWARHKEAQDQSPVIYENTEEVITEIKSYIDTATETLAAIEVLKTRLRERMDGQ